MKTAGLFARLAAARCAQHVQDGSDIREGRGIGRPRIAVRLTLLGQPRTRVIGAQGCEVDVTWRLRRAFELVAYLALRPDRWAADASLGEAVWPDDDPDVVDRNLRPTVSDARRALSTAAGEPRRAPDPGARAKKTHALETILRDDGGFGLGTAIQWDVDVHRFDHDARLARVLAPEAPDRALACGLRAWRRCRGLLLEGRDGPWVLEERAAFAHRYQRLLRTVAEAALAVGARETAMDAYRTLLVDDPYDEAAHLALMEIHGLDRRPDLVRRQFMRLEDRLRELDVEPRESTRDLFLSLVSG